MAANAPRPNAYGGRRSRAKRPFMDGYKLAGRLERLAPVRRSGQHGCTGIADSTANLRFNQGENQSGQIGLISVQLGWFVAMNEPLYLCPAPMAVVLSPVMHPFPKRGIQSYDSFCGLKKHRLQKRRKLPCVQR